MQAQSHWGLGDEQLILLECPAVSDIEEIWLALQTALVEMARLVMPAIVQEAYQSMPC